MDLIAYGASLLSKNQMGCGPHFQPLIITIMSSIARQKLHLLVSVLSGIYLGLSFSVADISIGLALTSSLKLNVSASGPWSVHRLVAFLSSLIK
jgi:hypothetical protein